MIFYQMGKVMEKMLSTKKTDAPTVAVLLPCYNEEAAISGVIKAFQQALPNAQIYVCDNNSSDTTAAKTLAAGATVLTEARRGKAYAVQHLFQHVEADIYILCDGDLTYDAAAAPKMIACLLEKKSGMVVGVRCPKEGQKTFRPGHGFGNFAFTGMMRLFFGGELRDVLSGYRVFSRAFVKSFPSLSKGFDIEVEMTAHALATGLGLEEIDTDYFERVEGSSSKLNTLKDGAIIARTMIRLVIDFQPLKVFSFLAVLQIIVAFVLFEPVLAEYFETGLVDRLPTAILCLGLVVTGLFTGFMGIILDSISRHRVETKKLAYLSMVSSGRVNG